MSIEGAAIDPGRILVLAHPDCQRETLLSRVTGTAKGNGCVNLRLVCTCCGLEHTKSLFTWERIEAAEKAGAA